MTPVALKFQVGARTLATVRRRLVRVPVALPAVLAGHAPVLPGLPVDADGYLVTSLPGSQRVELAAAVPTLLVHLRQRYTRYHTDLTLGFDAYLVGMSANARSGLKRKARRLAAASGGALAIERFATPAELDRFHPLARQLSASTYQERLLGGGFPVDAPFRAAMQAAAARDDVRAWLLRIEGRPAAYLYTEARDGVLRYDHVGHDPAFGELSPGSVLMLEAMRGLMIERRFALFDFTEGEGQHKRQFATGATDCVDLLLLRPSVMNRLVAASLGGFDRLVAAGKGVAARPAFRGLAKTIRRAS